MSPPRSTICIAEDRTAHEPSLKLLLLSLIAHCPGMEINLFYPVADQKFLAWVQKYPQVHLQTEDLRKGMGWNVKPLAILSLLEQGYDEVVWTDSDVIVTRNIASVFSGIDKQVFMISDQGKDRLALNAVRASSWGFTVGRVLPFELNSGVFRATKDHYPLMQRWRELVHSEEYQHFQQKVGWERSPAHMKGDQDVLSALLVSTEFSHVPVRLIRTGRDIILFDGIFGYSVGARIRSLFRGSPPFIHIPGFKPWLANMWKLKRPVRLKDYIEHVYFDVSSYTLSGLQFRDELECDTGWMDPHYGLGRFFRAAGLGCQPLVGLPIAALADVVRFGRLTFKSRRVQPSLSTEQS